MKLVFGKSPDSIFNIVTFLGKKSYDYIGDDDEYSGISYCNAIWWWKRATSEWSIGTIHYTFYYTNAVCTIAAGNHVINLMGYLVTDLETIKYRLMPPKK